MVYTHAVIECHDMLECHGVMLPLSYSIIFNVIFDIEEQFSNLQ